MNTKMKVLSLALVGLCGYAGSALAVCPTTPVGPWSSVFTTTGSTFAIVAGGLDSSACKATSTLNSSIAAAATVTNTIGSTEPAYRFQFLVDTTALNPFSIVDAVSLIRTGAGTSAHGSGNLLSVKLIDGAAAGTYRIRFIATCNNAPAYTCAQTSPADLTSGVHRIEGQLAVGAGAAGVFNYWVDAAAGTTAPPPLGTIASLDNAAWSGVSSAILGLSGPTSSLAPNLAGKAVGFDTFDSRRQTYIGY